MNALNIDVIQNTFGYQFLFSDLYAEQNADQIGLKEKEYDSSLVKWCYEQRKR